MKRRTGVLLAIGIGLACESTDPRGGQSVRGTAATKLAGDAFVANSQCTIAATWDPPFDAPSAEALVQLAPQGKLRIGVFAGNRAIGQLNATTGALTGTAVDVACRMGAQLGLPVDFVADPSLPNFGARFRAREFDIGFAAETTLPASDQAVAHPFVGIENTYLLPIASPFQSVSDVDQPGVLIAVPQGAAPDLYLTAHLKYATLVRALSTTGVQSTAAFNLLKDGKVDAVATGRSGELNFIDTMWPGQGRVLPENIFVAGLGPFMHQGNPDAVCWLTDYIEAAKASGLLAQAIARTNITIGLAVPAPLPGCAPAARCRDVTMPADGSCQASASINAGSDDPDSDLADCTQSPAGPYALGTTPVTLTCADSEGLTSTCNATVTVVDTTPPVIACPADQRLECTVEGAIASFVPAVTDNCGTASVQCTPPSGTTFSEDAAPTAVSCVAVDAVGNQAACGFQIAVHDTLPPVVTPKLEANGFSATLWPPNHSYHTITLSDCIQSVADQCDGALPVRGTILRVTSDEPEGGVGEDDDGTCDDIVLVDSTTVKLRAERSDESDGRVYSLFALITDDHGNQAPLTCKVQVPRHHETSALEGAALYCVGQGCGSVPGHQRRCRRDDDDERGDDGDPRHSHR